MITTDDTIVTPKLNLKDSPTAHSRATKVLGSVVIKDGATTLTITQHGLDSYGKLA